MLATSSIRSPTRRRQDKGVRHEDLHRFRQPEGHPGPRAARHHRRHHDQPVAAGQGVRRLQGDPEEDLPDRAGADQRRGGGDRSRGDDQAGTRPGQDRSVDRRQGAAHA